MFVPLKIEIAKFRSRLRRLQELLGAIYAEKNAKYVSAFMSQVGQANFD